MSLQKNRMYLLKDVSHLLRVGDEIITNADENISQPGYFNATILYINGADIACKRADNEEGGGENGEWIITSDPESPAQVMFYDSSLGTTVPLASTKFGDVIRYNDTLVVVMHKVRERVYTRPFFEGSRDPNVYIPNPENALIIKMFKTKLECERDGCDKMATTSVPGYGVFCAAHAADYGPIVECTDCGSPILQNEAQRITRRGRATYLCGPCGDVRREAARVIKQYSYKPQPLFITAEPLTDEWLSRLFLGVEQEVECPMEITDDMDVSDDGYAHVTEVFGKTVIDKFFEPKKWFYLKHDGSLANGFEFVTHPATLSGHYDLPWENVCKEYKKLNIRADNTTSCGLHIHASKDILTSDHQIRLGYFVTANRARIEKVARRTSGYARFKSPTGEILHMNRNEFGRYDALNWSPDATVEFRMFKGTVLYDVLMASVEFAHACIAFTKDRTIDQLQLSSGAWAEFMRFVNRSNYRFLPNYLAERAV